MARKGDRPQATKLAREVTFRLQRIKQECSIGTHVGASIAASW